MCARLPLTPLYRKCQWATIKLSLSFSHSLSLSYHIQSAKTTHIIDVDVNKVWLLTIHCLIYCAGYGFLCLAYCDVRLLLATVDNTDSEEEEEAAAAHY